jgi:hypothetical protein
MTNQPDKPDNESTRDLALRLARGGDGLQRQPLQVTTGAGIAIAGAWLAGSLVTITILIIAFVLTPAEELGLEDAGWLAVAFIFVIASPMIAAYSISKVILSKD